MPRKKKAKDPQITVTHLEEGVQVNVKGAYSREHATWMLAQAITRINTPEQEVVEDELQELSTTDTTEEAEEEDMSKLPN